VLEPAESAGVNDAGTITGGLLIDRTASSRRSAGIVPRVLDQVAVPLYGIKRLLIVNVVLWTSHIIIVSELPIRSCSLRLAGKRIDAESEREPSEKTVA